jgi:hypothetical protein
VVAGIGRAAAFTSDLKDRWGAAWTQWPGAARLVAQVGRDVARKGEDARVRLEADAAGGQLSVHASVVGDDGRAASFRRLVVHVAGPEGFAREVALEAVGAGAYAATVPLSRPGTYIAVARDELTGEAVGTTGAALGAGRGAATHRQRPGAARSGRRADRRQAPRHARRHLRRSGGAPLRVQSGDDAAVGDRGLRAPAGRRRAPARAARKRSPGFRHGSRRAAAPLQGRPKHLPTPSRRWSHFLPPATEHAPSDQLPGGPPASTGNAGPSPSATSAPGNGAPAPATSTTASPIDEAAPPSRRPLTAAEILLARRKGRGS